MAEMKPISVNCKNCGKEIVLTQRHAEPGTYVPRERIHHVFMFERPAFCIRCHHFTVFAPEGPNNVN